MPEYECDLCDAPADYNFQDATIRYTIVDDDFSDEPPKVSDILVNYRMIFIVPPVPIRLKHVLFMLKLLNLKMFHTHILKRLRI